MENERIRGKLKIRKHIYDYILLILGCMIMAFSTSFFLLPNQLSSGGFTGIATITYYLFKLPVGAVLIALNIPLLIISYFRIGKKFLVKSLLGTSFLAIFIDIFDKFPPLTEDRILGCIYGGIIMGIGTSLILSSSSSTGGTDLLSYIIKSYKPYYRTSNLIVAIDIIIVALNVIFFKDIEIGLYSAITIYLMGKMIDIIFEGIYFTKMIFIVSDKYEEISNKIEENVRRGVTGLEAKGMYTNEGKMMLWCISSRNETIRIKQICREIDKNCFIVICNAREAYGIGFKKN